MNHRYFSWMKSFYIGGKRDVILHRYSSYSSLFSLFLSSFPHSPPLSPLPSPLSPRHPPLDTLPLSSTLSPRHSPLFPLSSPSPSPPPPLSRLPSPLTSLLSFFTHLTILIYFYFFCLSFLQDQWELRSRHAMSCHVTPRHATSRHVTPRLVMLCYVVMPLRINKQSFMFYRKSYIFERGEGRGERGERRDGEKFKQIK